MYSGTLVAFSNLINSILILIVTISLNSMNKRIEDLQNKLKFMEWIQKTRKRGEQNPKK